MIEMMDGVFFLVRSGVVVDISIFYRGINDGWCIYYVRRSRSRIFLAWKMIKSIQIKHTVYVVAMRIWYPNPNANSRIPILLLVTLSH